MEAPSGPAEMRRRPSAEEGVPPLGSSSKADQHLQEPELTAALELEAAQRLAAEAAAEAIASIRRC